MRGTVVLGYDVETASPTTVGFLEGARRLHRELAVPWAIYLTGKTAAAYPDQIRAVVEAEADLLTVGQHTYHHTLFKAVFMQPGDGQPIHGRSPHFFKDGGSPAQLREEVEATQRLLKDRLGVECQGLTTPWGSFIQRGRDLGLRFASPPQVYAEWKALAAEAAG